MMERTARDPPKYNSASVTFEVWAEEQGVKWGRNEGTGEVWSCVVFNQTYLYCFAFSLPPHLIFSISLPKVVLSYDSAINGKQLFMNAQQVITWTTLGEVTEILNITNDLEIHNFVSIKYHIFFYYSSSNFCSVISVKKKRVYLMIAIIDK